LAAHWQISGKTSIFYGDFGSSILSLTLTLNPDFIGKPGTCERLTYLDNEYVKFYASLSTIFISLDPSLYSIQIFTPCSFSFRPQVQNLLFTLREHNGILQKEKYII